MPPSLTMSQCRVRSVSPENRFSNSYSPSNHPLNPKRTRKSQTKKRTDKEMEKQTEKQTEKQAEKKTDGDGDCEDADADEDEDPVGDTSTDLSSFEEEEGQDRGKRDLPVKILASAVKGREVFSSKFAFTPTATLVSYIPKKNRNVLLTGTARGGRRQRPRGQETDHRPGLQPQQRWRRQPRQGDRNIQLQEDNRTLAPGRLPQHSRCLFLQRLRDMERDQP